WCEWTPPARCASTPYRVDQFQTTAPGYAIIGVADAQTRPRHVPGIEPVPARPSEIIHFGISSKVVIPDDTLPADARLPIRFGITGAASGRDRVALLVQKQRGAGFRSEGEPRNHCGRYTNGSGKKISAFHISPASGWTFIDIT